MSKRTITVTLPDGTSKVLEGVGEIHEIPRAFWVGIADTLGLQGIRNAVSCHWDCANTQYGDHGRQFVWKHRVTVSRGVQTGPNYMDYTKPGATVEVVRVVDWSA